MTKSSAAPWCLCFSPVSAFTIKLTHKTPFVSCLNGHSSTLLSELVSNTRTSNQVMVYLIVAGVNSFQGMCCFHFKNCINIIVPKVMDWFFPCSNLAEYFTSLLANQKPENRWYIFSLSLKYTSLVKNTIIKTWRSKQVATFKHIYLTVPACWEVKSWWRVNKTVSSFQVKPSRFNSAGLQRSAATMWFSALLKSTHHQQPR